MVSLIGHDVHKHLLHTPATMHEATVHGPPTMVDWDTWAVSQHPSSLSLSQVVSIVGFVPTARKEVGHVTQQGACAASVKTWVWIPGAHNHLNALLVLTLPGMGKQDTETGRSLAAPWLNRLADLVKPQANDRPCFKPEMEGLWEITPGAVLPPPHICSCMCCCCDHTPWPKTTSEGKELIWFIPPGHKQTNKNQPDIINLNNQPSKKPIK